MCNDGDGLSGQRPTRPASRTPSPSIVAQLTSGHWTPLTHSQGSNRPSRRARGLIASKLNPVAGCHEKQRPPGGTSIRFLVDFQRASSTLHIAAPGDDDEIDRSRSLDYVDGHFCGPLRRTATNIRFLVRNRFCCLLSSFQPRGFRVRPLMADLQVGQRLPSRSEQQRMATEKEGGGHSRVWSVERGGHFDRGVRRPYKTKTDRNAGLKTVDYSITTMSIDPHRSLACFHGLGNR